MNKLDIVDRLSIHRTMSQYLTGGQLLLDLNCDRAAAKAEIERLRTQAKRHEAEKAELVAALKENHQRNIDCDDHYAYKDSVLCEMNVSAIAKYEVKP